MPRVLIVDDDQQMRLMLHLMLRREGHEVFAVNDGEEALLSLRQHHTDLVITDIVMPNKEGLETITELRREYPFVKIIAMTGYCPPKGSYLAMATVLGAHKTIRKPFAIDELLGKVRELLRDQ